MGFKDSRLELKKDIHSYSPLIYVKTEEEKPLMDALSDIIKESDRDFELFSWSRGGGLFSEDKPSDEFKDVQDPIVMLNVIKQYNKNAIFVLHDFHRWFDEKDDYILHLKDTAQSIYNPSDQSDTYEKHKMDNKPLKYIVISSAVKRIPIELQKICSVVEFDLPDYDDIEHILDKFISSKNNGPTLSEEEKKQVINASLGLTQGEILTSFRKSFHANNAKIDADFIVKEKRHIIQRDGLLKYFESDIRIEDAGGLKNLIQWIKKRKVIFDDRLRDKYKISNPKGMLLTGVPGTGKSYSAKMIANYLQMPLIGLDIGNLMSMWVGESEENLTKALQIVETVAPCVLWIDEFDKAIPNLSNNQSHETTKRMMSTLLTWLQEKKGKIFVIATANNIHHLPPEIMRKGRFDEIFFVDLPSVEERKEIFHIHLRKKTLDPTSFNLDSLAEASHGFSGAEIEAVVNEGCILAAFDDAEVNDEHMISEIKNTNPLSKTMENEISAIRDWAEEFHIRRAN